MVPEPSANPTDTVRVLDKTVVFQDTLCRVGQLVTVPLAVARRWIDQGRAEPANLIQIRFLKPMFHGNRCFSAGEEARVLEPAVRYLYEAGVIEVLEPEKLTAALPPVKKAESFSLPNPLDGVRTVKAIVRKAFFWDSSVVQAGAELVMPEKPACDAAHNGVVDVDHKQLSPRGQQYLQNLKNTSNPQHY